MPLTRMGRRKQGVRANERPEIKPQSKDQRMPEGTEALDFALPLRCLAP
jgi:hypothetical protein